MDFPSVLERAREIERGLLLHPHPGIGRAAEGLGWANGHHRRYRRLLVDDVVERLARHAKNLHCVGDAEAERLKAVQYKKSIDELTQTLSRLKTSR